jgi:hypothetical protein
MDPYELLRDHALEPLARRDACRLLLLRTALALVRRWKDAFELLCEGVRVFDS